MWRLLLPLALASENDVVTQTSEEAEKQAELWHSNNFMYNYPMYTVLVPSGKTDCYFHTTHDSIHFDFMVEKGGSLDIDFAAYNADTEEVIYRRNGDFHSHFNRALIDKVYLSLQSTKQNRLPQV